MSCCATRRVLQPHPGSVAVLRIRGLTSISDGRVQEAGSTLDLSRGALYPPTLLLLLLPSSRGSERASLQGR